jgi:hypothetical protein
MERVTEGIKCYVTNNLRCWLNGYIPAQGGKYIISLDGSLALLVCSEGGLLKYSWVIFSIQFLNPAKEQDPLDPGRVPGVVVLWAQYASYNIHFPYWAVQFSSEAGKGVCCKQPEKNRL